jgi:hypothetical protein
MGTPINLIVGEDAPFHFAEFEDVSRSMLNGYARLTQLGLPGETVAHAMLGATVNLYQMFDMHDDLPELLRALALRLEGDQMALWPGVN